MKRLQFKPKLFAIIAILLCWCAAMAQQPLPLNPEVRHGVLPNGLTYYVLHNSYPRNRANFYIAQKVGSALETPEQYGLAHFLEHMAFNGTRHFPGDSLLRYLESNGIRFGADVNAYTDYEETVYNIDNVPTDNTALMDSVLLALRDWSCDLTLDDAEIDAERKVIQEEWRMRNDPDWRFRTAMAPAIFSERQYHLTPIGTMEVVMNFPYSALRDYYHKWYRPDLQGIIIVGDFDADEMERKVVSTFSDIPMPENPSPREYVRVSDNEEPLFFAFEDPEQKSGRVDFQIKTDPLPQEYRNTDIALFTSMTRDVMAAMINTRLQEHLQDPGCRYANAGVYFAEMYPSKTKEIFNLAVIAKDDESAALEDALAILARCCSKGFTQSELDRAVSNIRSAYDMQYNERDNTHTSVLAKGLIDAFKDNAPDPGIAAERDFFINAVVPLPAESYDRAAAALITTANRVVMVRQQKKEGKRLPGREETLALIDEVLGREYEAYADEAAAESLIAVLPKKGSIVSVEKGKFDTEVLTLSNGMKVILRPTGFKDDEILFQAFRKGGKICHPAEDAADLMMIGDAFSLSDMGALDNVGMSRYLAGKNVELQFGIGQFTDFFSGCSSVKDLPTLLELIHVAFTDVNPNPDAYAAAIARIMPQLETAEKSPDFIFGRHRDKAVYGDNPMAAGMSADMVRKADYRRMMKLYEESVSCPADYTLLFTGNVDAEALLPLLEQYVASLPARRSEDRKVLTSMDTAEGINDDDFTVEMEAPADWLYGFYSGSDVADDIASQVKTGLVGDVLAILYHDVLREKEGGVYSPHVFSSYDIANGKWNIVYFLQTNEEQSADMLRLADSLLNDLLRDGATPEQFNRVKEARLKQYENAVMTNSYWHDNIRLYYLLGKDYITDHRAALENLTLEDFNAFMRGLHDGKNRIRVNMHGVSQQH